MLRAHTNIEKEKLVNLRYIGYITANLHKNIPSSCWDPLQVYKSTQISVLTNLPIFAILQKFSAVTPVKFSGKTAPGVLNICEKFCGPKFINAEER